MQEKHIGIPTVADWFTRNPSFRKLWDRLLQITSHNIQKERKTSLFLYNFRTENDPLLFHLKQLLIAPQSQGKLEHFYRVS